MKEIINYPGRAIGCERIEKEKYEIILYLIAQMETTSRAPRVIFAYLKAQKRKTLSRFARKDHILDGLSIVKDQFFINSRSGVVSCERK